MRRKLYETMRSWKESGNGRTALMIDGARRVGKSYLAEAFAKNEYRSYILIDFARLPDDVRAIFEHDKDDFNLFFEKLSSYYRVKLYKRNSLIIFDEVQRYPQARELVKYLVADGRYDYMETGSLLSLRQNTASIVIPSEEEHVELFPMDFEEYLWACGDETTIPMLAARFQEKQPLGQALHRRIMNDYRQYMLTGGMPQAVQTFVNGGAFEEVDSIKRNILKLYRNDVTKFARENTAKVLSIFDNLPSQLSTREKIYHLSSINRNARTRSYEEAFMWLSEAKITYDCYNATEPSASLSMSMTHTTRKVYMADTGLLITHAFMDSDYVDNDLYHAVLFDRLHVNEGMLMENMVAQELRSHGHKLFFYSRSDTNHRENHMEIDFLIRRGRKICPVEVKSAVYRKHSSLDKFRSKFSKKIGQPYILYTKDVMEKDDVLHLPLYMAMFL